MSDKQFDRLNVLDQMLRRTVWDGPDTEGVQVTITKRCGFEAYNTRPYHNYENWGSGYIVEGRGVRVDREDLDDAVREWCEKVTLAKATP